MPHFSIDHEVARLVQKEITFCEAPFARDDVQAFHVADAFDKPAFFCVQIRVARHPFNLLDQPVLPRNLDIFQFCYQITELPSPWVDWQPDRVADSEREIVQLDFFARKRGNGENFRAILAHQTEIFMLHTGRAELSGARHFPVGNPVDSRIGGKQAHFFDAAADPAGLDLKIPFVGRFEPVDIL